MRIGCCELAKLDMEQLFCAIIRSYRATAITWLASRLLFFSTILPHTAAHREPRRRHALPIEAIAARYLAFRAQARIYLTGIEGFPRSFREEAIGSLP